MGQSHLCRPTHIAPLPAALDSKAAHHRHAREDYIRELHASQQALTHNLKALVKGMQPVAPLAPGGIGWGASVATRTCPLGLSAPARPADLDGVLSLQAAQASSQQLDTLKSLPTRLRVLKTKLQVVQARLDRIEVRGCTLQRAPGVIEPSLLVGGLA